VAAPSGAAVNVNFAKLPGSYLFAEMGRRQELFRAGHPGVKLLHLRNRGCHAAAVPLRSSTPWHRAVDVMASAETFRGYPPYYAMISCGRAIAQNDFAWRGEYPGGRDLRQRRRQNRLRQRRRSLRAGCVVAVCDPVYPCMWTAPPWPAGPATYSTPWTKLVYLPCTEENGFFAGAARAARGSRLALCSPTTPPEPPFTRRDLKNMGGYANRARLRPALRPRPTRLCHVARRAADLYEIPGRRPAPIEFHSSPNRPASPGPAAVHGGAPETDPRRHEPDGNAREGGSAPSSTAYPNIVQQRRGRRLHGAGQTRAGGSHGILPEKRSRHAHRAHGGGHPLQRSAWIPPISGSVSPAASIPGQASTCC
jgi:LL-diaminopimelate aminotransferase